MENKEKEATGLLELCIDREHITITVDKFTELIQKEAALDLVRNIYFNAESYEIQKYLAVLFGPIHKRRKEDA